MITVHGNTYSRLWVSAISLVIAGTAQGGAYIFAEQYGLDIITHPSGYNGTGGDLHIKVCIAPSVAEGKSVEIPVLNTLKVFNLLQETSPNLFFDNDNDIPFTQFDFQSLISHEIGHCIGLAHPNQGNKIGVLGDDRDSTNSRQGDDGDYDFDSGSDGIPGSADDLRDDDPNLHWFVPNVNNPFVTVGNPQAGNYSRDLTDLPMTDSYPANAGRAVGPNLGAPNTEAMMQQGQFNDEEQRQMMADDVATLRMAMTGVDRTAGTGDDYSLRLVYGGFNDDVDECDVVIQSGINGFGVCDVGGFLFGNYAVINGATVTYNTNTDWYFNPVQDAQCTAPDNNITISGGIESSENVIEACTSVSLEDGYRIHAGGDVTVVSPQVTLAPGTRVDGRLRTFAGVP